MRTHFSGPLGELLYFDTPSAAQSPFKVWTYRRVLEASCPAGLAQDFSITSFSWSVEGVNQRRWPLLREREITQKGTDRVTLLEAHRMTTGTD